MFISGMIMVTRNRYVCVHLQPHARRTQHLAHTCLWACRYLAWPAFLLSLNSVINQHPLRTKEGGQNNVSVLMCVLCSFPPSPLVLRRANICQVGYCCHCGFVYTSCDDYATKACCIDHHGSLCHRAIRTSEVQILTCFMYPEDAQVDFSVFDGM